MKSVNALQVRQSLGRVLDELDATEEPILVERGRRPVAVLLPLRIFHQRFADLAVHEERLALARWIEARQQVRALDAAPAEAMLRGLRGSLP
ncbi:MAG: type II toxin-antitoxin system Phd/YefM family antitoxin [Deltaproteobacteria bacterium]|nr:type II toxin-antitoxin system Phd/YefM family antitoxin [Deltaproteobacteria bacterium]